ESRAAARVAGYRYPGGQRARVVAASERRQLIDGVGRAREHRRRGSLEELGQGLDLAAPIVETLDAQVEQRLGLLATDAGGEAGIGPPRCPRGTQRLQGLIDASEFRRGGGERRARRLPSRGRPEIPPCLLRAGTGWARMRP